MPLLPLARPPPPIPPLSGQTRIAGLCHGAAQRVEHTRIVPDTRYFTQAFIELVTIAPGQLRDRLHIQEMKIALNGRTYARKIAQTPLLFTLRRSEFVPS